MTTENTHTRLMALWVQLMNVDHVRRNVAIVLDRASHKSLFSSSDAMRDGSLRLEERDKWRDIPVEVTYTLAPDAPGLDDVEIPLDRFAIREPVCVYMRVTKGNGRVIYLDHPDTDEVYK